MDSNSYPSLSFHFKGNCSTFLIARYNICCSLGHAVTARICSHTYFPTRFALCVCFSNPFCSLFFWLCSSFCPSKFGLFSHVSFFCAFTIFFGRWPPLVFFRCSCHEVNFFRSFSGSLFAVSISSHVLQCFCVVRWIFGASGSVSWSSGENFACWHGGVSCWCRVGGGWGGGAGWRVDNNVLVL